MEIHKHRFANFFGLKINRDIQIVYIIYYTDYDNDCDKICTTNELYF